MNLPSSDPLIIIKSNPKSLASAFIVEVFPIPGGPDRIRLGTSFVDLALLKKSFSDLGKIHSSIVLGAYFSTKRKSSFII